MEQDIDTKSDNLFIDLFAGCGGLSLGLFRAGWKGLFAIEKNEDAFKTLKANLIEGKHHLFDWPCEIPKEPIGIKEFLVEHKDFLDTLKGKITLLAGGPPCQGFSPAGRRKFHDPRNKLVEEYLEFVRILEPRFLLIENVRGFTAPFKENGKTYPAVYKGVIKSLKKLGYKVDHKIITSSEWGIPQKRPRFFLLAEKTSDDWKTKPFDLFALGRESFLEKNGLPIDRPTSVFEALSDLEVNGKHLVDCEDSPPFGFKQINYKSPENPSPYQKIVINGVQPNSLRLPRHRKETIKKFKNILSICEKGRTITKESREALGIKKHAITPLDPNAPSATVTTLPDDILHYSEPRILTVRETARLQSFPDWFDFHGQYTTGGKKRKNACPRYTQVGNAVPPLLAEALGALIMDLK